MKPAGHAFRGLLSFALVFLGWVINLPNAFAGEPASLQLAECLSLRITSQEFDSCIGLLAEPCAAKASDNDNAMQRLADMSQCYWNEYQLWDQMLTNSAEGWHEEDSTPLASSIEAAGEELKIFRQAKCGVFENMQQFGVTGQVLAAQCQMEETARMAIFVGYKLN